MLAIFDSAAAWADYDAAARDLPGCEHNRAWREQGAGRPQPPDCEHNRAWRARVRAAWLTYLAALDNDRLEGRGWPWGSARWPAA